jgi:uncharacterized protein (UPF0303 family)
VATPASVQRSRPSIKMRPRAFDGDLSHGAGLRLRGARLSGAPGHARRGRDGARRAGRTPPGEEQDVDQQFPSYQELVGEEEELQFSSFTNDDAWALGCALVDAARARSAPVAIDVSRNGHQLFHAALPGAAPDNDDWIERKVRVVQRYGHSSLAVGQLWRERGTTFEDAVQVDHRRYAAHGGAFPVSVRSVGAVGAVAVSGLPQVDDHRLVVSAIRDLLGG